MNTTFVLLLVAALGVSAINCAPQSSTADVAQAVSELFAAYKHMVPCGDASLGIPVLAPFRAAHVAVDVNEELLTLKGSIDNLVLSGLGDFIGVGISTNASTSRTTFDILYEDLQVLGEINLYINADLGGYQFVETLVGLVNLQFKQLRFNGGFTIGTNSVGGVLDNDVEIYVQLGDVVSLTTNNNHSVAVGNYYRNLIQNSLMLYVQEQCEFLSKLISKHIANKFNAALYNVTPSQNIQGMINTANRWNAITC